MSGVMKTIEPTMSLHEVMNRIQLRFMTEQAMQIERHLPSLLESTWHVAPVRRKSPYKLHRSEEPRKIRRLRNAHGKWDEKHWEEACHHKWTSGTVELPPSIPFS